MEDAASIYTLQTFLATILKVDDILVIPLTVGNHVDHQIVRIAAEQLERPLLYYADAPYVFNHPEKAIEVTRDLNSRLYNFSPQSLVSWQDASQAYASQLDVLFRGVEKMRSTMDLYYQKENGLCLWKSICD